MSTVQVVTIASVVKAVDEYMANNKLLAKWAASHHLHHVSTSYVADNGCRCAIGAALTDETLAKMKEKKLNYVNVLRLRREGLITCSDIEAEHLFVLQWHHDAWATQPQNKLSENRFMTTLNQLREYQHGITPKPADS